MLCGAMVTVIILYEINKQPNFCREAYGKIGKKGKIGKACQNYSLSPIECTPISSWSVENF